MTATEELRRLLDERGVEWTANDGEYVKETCWIYMGELTAAFAEYYDGTTRFACDTWCFNPAQAIDATLRRGTCRNVHEPPRNTAFWPIPHFKCSECGATHISMDYVYYCPSCGAEVVDE